MIFFSPWSSAAFKCCALGALMLGGVWLANFPLLLAPMSVPPRTSIVRQSPAQDSSPVLTVPCDDHSDYD